MFIIPSATNAPYKGEDLHQWKDQLDLSLSLGSPARHPQLILGQRLRPQGQTSSVVFPFDRSLTEICGDPSVSGSSPITSTLA
ncbi:hypothetical protein PoB_004682600 [Plakobranchus ocellatus]|uniref:Uncharacterized protein n=1 Tax=Plakobranchus ocellatus TaxID=259542 RepID=A0AAV4BAF9_9GAST|nr:hypothetical protein PoB_004682600 [Plakobranchus ocellatus]